VSPAARGGRDPQAGDRECHVQRTVCLGLTGCLRAMVVTSRTAGRHDRGKETGPCSEPFPLSWPRLAPGRRCQRWGLKMFLAPVVLGEFALGVGEKDLGVPLMPAGRC
jgi:hypothetical protein